MATTSIRTTTPEVTPNTRATRALELFEKRGHLVRSIASDTYTVPSCGMQGRRYSVRYGGHVEESCSCKDWEFGHICKHLLAVGVMHAARRGGVRELRTLEVAAGDPFRTAKVAGRLDKLEDQLAHELLGIEERCELQDRVRRVRRRLASGR